MIVPVLLIPVYLGVFAVSRHCGSLRVAADAFFDCGIVVARGAAALPDSEFWARGLVGHESRIGGRVSLSG
jgi:hypothetical protein